MLMVEAVLTIEGVPTVKAMVLDSANSSSPKIFLVAVST